MSDSKHLTIVIVAGPGDEELIRKNLLHIEQENPGNEYFAHVIDNGRFHGYPPISFDFPNVAVHLGFPPDPTKPNACRGSYQHAAAVNQFLRDNEITTPYLLILDPDFYIVRNQWIADVTNHMSKRGLAFFGAPWHPKWYSKYRYFPCVHCMFIDARQIDCRHLDYTPDLIERGEKADKRAVSGQPCKSQFTEAYDHAPIVPRKWFPIFLEITREALHTLHDIYAEAGQPIPRTLKVTIRTTQRAVKLKLELQAFAHILVKLKRKLRVLTKSIISLLINRRYIGCSNDTGYLVAKRYALMQRSATETLTPNVILARDFTKPHYLTTRWGKMIERVIPDRWSYIPKLQGYFTNMGFKSHGLPDLAPLGWEEFMWRGSPFGFHMRRYNKVKRNFHEEELCLTQVLKI